MTDNALTSAEPSTQTTRKFDAAIFDLGGVMTEPLFRDRHDIDPQYLNLVAFFLNDFRDHYHLPTGAHDLHLLETGQLSDDEFFDRMCNRYAEAGNEPVDARVAQKIIFGRGMVASSAMADAVRQVRGGGYKTALLTNISRDGDAMWRSLIPVDDLFDVVVDSSRVGLRKPDPRIYELTCERLAVAPERCLFVDDLACNVEAAARLGMHVIQCLDPVSVADDVVRLLLGHPAAQEA
ncbi:MAG TPA: HAD family phosphatase [Candidatus Dormibacteraeota bacterium]|nr:HAD family phosphatase [Candidatus Dormibacteraeota bacterium]